jgi:hypothetical protein
MSGLLTRLLPGSFIERHAGSIEEPAKVMLRAGVSEAQHVPITQLGNITPLATPGMEAKREVQMV